MTDWTIQTTTWAAHEADCRAVRTAVFMQEQNVPEELEWDGEDDKAMHLIVHDKQGQAIATARMLTNGHIGRMAVLPEWRGRGIGSAMLKQLTQLARMGQLPEVMLHAQVSAIRFYQKLGFELVSDTFMDAGIPHRSMRLSFSKQTENPLAWRNQRVGQHARNYAIKNANELTLAITQLAEQAEYRVDLLTQHLCDDWYQDEAFTLALKQLIMRGRNRQIRVLLSDAKPIVQQSHGVLDLAQRLSSYVQLRIVHPQDQPLRGAWILVDQKAYAVQERWDRPEGLINLHNPLKARDLYDRFERLWERAEHDPNLRALSI